MVSYLIYTLSPFLAINCTCPPIIRFINVLLHYGISVDIRMYNLFLIVCFQMTQRLPMYAELLTKASELDYKQQIIK